MRIKSLELNGFKSFVDKTRIEFPKGITAVVGPNGCGKSNVVDAMRWVMGEQSPRRLRGKGMEDVIFAGSEGRAEIGMAEVVLTFDNSEGDAPPAFAPYAEIQIARRLYRSGESDYSMNKTPCRLRDIQDFFRDTGVGTKGYTIVEQGRIAEIVSARPEDRRTLIEEAAGIGKFKARRREAESRIKATQQNLLRVTDVLGEIRRQIGSIERQARKAARYKRLRQSLRVLDLSLAADDRRDFSGAIDSARRRHREKLDAVTAAETRLAERELSIETQRIEATECERVLSRENEALLALRGEIKETEGRIGYSRRERDTLGDTLAARRQELAQLREQRAGQEREAARLRQELAEVEAALESEGGQLAAAEAAVQGARAEREALEAEREAASERMLAIHTQVAREEDRLARFESRQSEIEGLLANAQQQIAAGELEAQRIVLELVKHEHARVEHVVERDRTTATLERAREALGEASERMRASAETAQRLRGEREVRAARLASLRELLEQQEDLRDGVRYLLEQDSGLREQWGVRGLARELFEADPGAEAAVEAVLAERAGALCVEDPQRAVALLAELRQRDAGRAIFLIATPSAPPSAEASTLGTALLERLRPRAGCEALVASWFGGVRLVGDLRDVLAAYPTGLPRCTFVTPSGDLIDGAGLVAGGQPATAGLLGRSRELRELEQEVAQLEAQASAAEATLLESRAAESRAAQQVDALQASCHAAALSVAGQQTEIERCRVRGEALREAQRRSEQECSRLFAERRDLDAQLQRARIDLENGLAQRAEAQEVAAGLVQRVAAAASEASRLEALAAAQRVEVAGRSQRRDGLRANADRVGSAEKETCSWIERREQEIASGMERSEELARDIEGCQRGLVQLLEREESARASIDEKRDAFEQAMAVVADLEEALRVLRGEISGFREESLQAELQLRESEMRLAHLDEQIREKWQVELAQWELPPLEAEAGADGEPPAQELEGAAVETALPNGEGTPDEEAEEAAPSAAREARHNAELARLPREQRERELQSIRSKIEALGDVHLGAIDEHEELSERFRFLSEQKTDLDQTLASLQDAIQRINRTSRKRFRETFELVSQRFSENFPRLFRGGKASLALTESEDILEAGIEIQAMPPGKKLKDVNLLSGGEKTLTAIALLVAVFQVRPSPFFLLDEVDAALDDANVGRFNEIVQELADASQFVLITHNKRTIEVADTLYGVTMERKGISKLVAVELH